MRHLLCSTAILCLLATSAHAAPFITNGEHAQQLSESKWRYSPELADTIDSITVTDTESVTSIEHRITISTAVGNDGPWRELPSLQRKSPWQPFAYSSNKSSIALNLPKTEDDFTVTATPEQILAAMKKEQFSYKEDEKRWLDAAKKCNSNAEYNPCYAYKSTDEFRVTRTSGKKEILIIDYPGGC